MAKAKKAKSKINANSSGVKLSDNRSSSDAATFKEYIETEAKPEVEIKWVDVECPHCEEDFEIRVDPSEEAHEMVQECQACGRSITFFVEVEEGEVSVSSFHK